RAAGPRLHLAGIDIDALPGGAYDDICCMLDESGLTATEFCAALVRQCGESATDEAKRLRAARTILPKAAPPSVAAALDTLAESLDYIAMTYTAQSYDAVRPGMAFRERAMKRRLTEAGRQLGTGQFVLMGHALHLAKDDSRISGTGVGPGGDAEPSL